MHVVLKLNCHVVCLEAARRVELYVTLHCVILVNSEVKNEMTAQSQAVVLRDPDLASRESHFLEQDYPSHTAI